MCPLLTLIKKKNIEKNLEKIFKINTEIKNMLKYVFLFVFKIFISNDFKRYLIDFFKCYSTKGT